MQLRGATDQMEVEEIALDVVEAVESGTVVVTRRGWLRLPPDVYFLMERCAATVRAIPSQPAHHRWAILPAAHSTTSTAMG